MSNQNHTLSSLLSVPKTSDCQRLFHGRGQCFPGLEQVCIDWFSPVVLITLYSEVNDLWLDEIKATIRERISGCRSIQVQYRYVLQAPVETLWGEPIDATVAVERGLKYHISLAHNRNHGLFLDMTNGRRWVFENSRDRRVLNLFAYTCAFSVSAVAGGATNVLNLDMSKSSLEKGRENHTLNGQALSRVSYAAVNLFKSWGKLRKGGKYDLLICDPPSFQKGSIDLKRDYKKIIKRIPEFMNAGSDLLLCLNSPDLDQRFLLDCVAEYCNDCHFVSRIENPEVFKDVDPERSLKVMHFKYNPL